MPGLDRRSGLPNDLGLTRIRVLHHLLVASEGPCLSLLWSERRRVALEQFEFFGGRRVGDGHVGHGQAAPAGRLRDTAGRGLVIVGGSPGRRSFAGRCRGRFDRFARLIGSGRRLGARGEGKGQQGPERERRAMCLHDPKASTRWGTGGTDMTSRVIDEVRRGGQATFVPKKLSKPNAPTGFLRRALLLNAAFSSLCALTLALFGHHLAPRMGLQGAWPLWVVAAGLAPFAYGVFRNARGARVDLGEARLTSLADLGWVLGSAALLLVWGDVFTPLGKALVVTVAAVVGLCATLQTVGVARAAGGGSPA